MPKPFEPSASYKGFAQSQGFQPIRPGDISPLLRQNQQTEQQSLQRILDQEMNVRRINQDAAQTQLRMDQDAEKQEKQRARDQLEQRYDSLRRNRELEQVFNEQQMEDLMGFSKTITESVQGLVEWRKNQVIESAMSEAFTMGLSPAEEALFNEREATAEGAAVLAKGMGASLEAAGAPVDLITKARNASGWKKYGYMKAIAMMAGASYGSYRENSPITVQIGDREIGFGNNAFPPQNSSEYAALERKIRDSYLKQFDGMNLGLLNKYLFPQMKAFEGKAAQAFAIKQKETLLSERKIDRKNSIYSAAIAGMNGEELMKQINLAAADFGGRGNARKEILKDLVEGLKSGRFKPEVAAHIENMLSDEVTFSDGVTESFSKRYARELDGLGVQDAIDDARSSQVDAELERQKDNARLFKTEIRKRLAESGEPLTFEKIQEYREIAKRQGITDLVDDFIGDMQTVEMQSVPEAKARAEGFIEAKGYISTLEAVNLPSTVRAYYKARNLIRDDAEMQPTSDELKNAKTIINQAADATFTKEGMQFAKKDQKYRDFVRTANEKYFYYYASEIKTADSHAVAHNNALKRVEDEIAKQGTNYGEARERVDTTNNRAILKQIGKNLKDNDGDFTAQLPFLESYVKQLGESFAAGKGTVPLIFKQIAAHINGPVSSFDVAAAQYKAYTGKTLQKPQVEQDFSKLSPFGQKLLNKMATGSSWEQVIAEDPKGPELFFNLVMSKEAISSCKYDSMTTGGSGFGLDNQAYGSACSGDALGVSIQEISVGEVMQRQANREIFAAGAFQIIPKTLRGIIKEAGVSPEDTFNEETQKKLAMALYRRRMRWHGNTPYALMHGLRNEWQGLYKVPEATLLKAIKGVSHYNQNPQLLPALQRDAGQRKAPKDSEGGQFVEGVGYVRADGAIEERGPTPQERANLR
jgi:hypothetical protein